MLKAYRPIASGSPCVAPSVDTISLPPIKNSRERLSLGINSVNWYIIRGHRTRVLCSAAALLSALIALEAR